MEYNKIVGSAIVATVAVILLATLLAPVVSDAMETERTFENHGMFYTKELEDTDTWELVWNGSNSLVVNGIEMTFTFPYFGVYDFSPISADTILTRWGYASSSSIYYMQFNHPDYDYVTAPGKITYDHGTLTVVSNGVTKYSQTVDDVYVIMPVKDSSLMKVSTSTAYLKGDSEIYATGLTASSKFGVSADWTSIHIEGTINDGLTITAPRLDYLNVDYQVQNIVLHKSEVGGFEDLFELTSITFDIVTAGGITPVTYSYFNVPSEVTAEKTNHIPTGAVPVLGAIIPIVLVAIIVSIGIIRRDY